MGLDSQAIFDQRVYAQDTQPDDQRDGIQWVDTSVSPRQLYVYSTDSQSFESVATDPPIYATDECTGFDGSEGETVTATNCEVVDGEVHYTGNGTTTTADLDDSSNTGVWKWKGVIFNPNNDLRGVRATMSGNVGSDVERVRIYDADAGAEVMRETGLMLNAGDTIELRPSETLTTGTKYYLQAWGDTYTEGYDSAPAFPYTATDLDITGGTNDSTSESTNRHNFIDVTAIVPTDGNMLVEWPIPADISEWDMVTYNDSPGPEDIVYDVEDGAGNVLVADVTDEHDISNLSTDDKVSIRASLTRTGPSDVRVGYVARRAIR